MPMIVQRGRNPIVAAAFAGLRADERKSSRSTAKPEVAHPKDDLVRSEEYRRLVAVRPCKNCGKRGRSQAAHVPALGKSIKQDDRETFALCTVSPGKHTPGCHEKFDQYLLGDRSWTVRQGKKWAAETRVEIAAEGQWPKRLPPWTDKKGAPKARRKAP